MALILVFCVVYAAVTRRLHGANTGILRGICRRLCDAQHRVLDHHGCVRPFACVFYAPKHRILNPYKNVKFSIICAWRLLYCKIQHWILCFASATLQTKPPSFKCNTICVWRLLHCKPHSIESIVICTWRLLHCKPNRPASNAIQSVPRLPHSIQVLYNLCLVFPANLITFVILCACPTLHCKPHIIKSIIICAFYTANDTAVNSL